jgi:hypothetical protein
VEDLGIDGKVVLTPIKTYRILAHQWTGRVENSIASNLVAIVKVVINLGVPKKSRPLLDHMNGY